MWMMLCSFAASAFLSLCIVRWWRVRDFLSPRDTGPTPQRVHARPAARFGGLGVLGGLLSAGIASGLAGGYELAKLTLQLSACALPAFLAGSLEDASGGVRPVFRLLATAASAALGVWVLEASITRTDLWVLDSIAAFPAGAAFLAILAVSGIANSMNIIDGVNGLSAMCAVLMLVAMAYVANVVGDGAVGMVAVIGVGAIMGFFLWNYPAGLVFLGDGGAYLLGFLVAEIGILLIQRNPSVSPLFPLLLVIYPVFETLFSMYRRKFVRGHPVSMPDGVHLHSLIYRRVLRWAVGTQDAKALTRRNSMTAPYLWLLCSLAVVPSVLFWDNSRVLGGFILLFAVTYVVLYARIVRFKAPRWLVARR